MNNHHASALLNTGTDLDKILPKIRTKDSDPDEESGIAYLPQVGLFGVIFGSAGSGKSVLALQLCCCFVANPERENPKLKTKQNKNLKPRHAIYITQERPHGVWARLREFGCFQRQGKWDAVEKAMDAPDDDRNWVKIGLKIQSEDKLFSVETEKGVGTVTIVHMPLDPKAQEDKLRYILGFLNKTFCCPDEDDYGSARDPKTRLLIAIDNADTISPSALLKATEQMEHPERPKRTFYKAIREYCALHRLNTWLVFEETEPQTTNDEYAFIATNEISYAADIVVRLGLTVFNLHYRERSIEIIKAKNQGYRRGRHHFSIRATGKVVDKGMNPGMVIYLSLATQLFQMSNHSSANRGGASQVAHGHRLGIREVDKAVRDANEGEFESGKTAYLSSGTVSVLVSDLDSLATELALHFALQEGLITESDIKQDRKRLLYPTPTSTIFFTNLHRKKQIEQMIGLYGNLKRFWCWLLSEDEKKARQKANPLPYKFEYPSQSWQDSVGAKLAKRPKFKIVELDSDHVTEGKLLHDIENEIDAMRTDWKGSAAGKKNNGRAIRVVFDNVFKLKAKYPLIRDAEHFLNALFVMFRYKNVTSLVIDTVEVGEGRNPLDQSYVAGMADHVFVLRHTESQAQPRKIFTVLKLAGYDEPDELWEIKKDLPGKAATRAMGHDHSHSYKGILSGKLQPVSVNLSLYADPPNSPLSAYLRDQADVFKRVFAHDVNYYACHPETYGAMQHSISTTGIEALGDCHVISLDEIWLEELIRGEKLVKISLADLTRLKDTEEGRRASRHTEFNEQDYVTISEDMARLFCGKAKDLNYAIPDRNNVGVLACNPVAWERCKRVTGCLPLVGLKGWKKIGCLPKWMASSNGAASKGGSQTSIPLTWNDIANLQKVYLSKLASHWDGGPLPATLYRQWEDRDLPGGIRRRQQTIAGIPDWGVFTFSFDHREPAVSFFLELLLSLVDDTEALFDKEGVDKAGATPRRLAFASAQQRKWKKALLLLVRLLSPWDLQRLADAWFRPCSVEMPCLFSRQWFSSAGIVGLKSPGLRVVELPKGETSKKSIPVSGAWYLGMLMGSTATRAGAEIISHLASKKEEHHKVRRMIGMPVRAELLKADNTLDARKRLPYKGAFLEMKKRRQRDLEGKKPERYLKTPIFYRGRIERYSDVSPLIFGAMVEAARITLHPDFEKWIWRRDKGKERGIGDKFDAIVKEVAARYAAIMSGS